MLFLPAKGSAGSQGLRAKNTLFVAEWRKGRFFPKQPEGLDLDGQAERANFASFFEFFGITNQTSFPLKIGTLGELRELGIARNQSINHHLKGWVGWGNAFSQVLWRSDERNERSRCRGFPLGYDTENREMERRTKPKLLLQQEHCVVDRN